MSAYIKADSSSLILSFEEQFCLQEECLHRRFARTHCLLSSTNLTLSLVPISVRFPQVTVSLASEQIGAERVLPRVKEPKEPKEMVRFLLLSIYTSFTWLSTSNTFPIASPLQSLFLDTLARDCKNLKQNLTQTCWDELGMADYLNDWWQANQAACGADTSFVSCYQQSVGVEQQQCESTGPNMCDYPENFSGYTPQQAYTLYSIFAIWQWFESIYEAIESADLSAGGPIGKIVKAINPEVKQEQSLGDFLQALTALTPLLAMPAKLGKAVTSVIETAMRQSPGVLKQLNPTGTLDSEIVQISDIYDGLSIINTSKISPPRSPWCKTTSPPFPSSPPTDPSSRPAAPSRPKPRT